MKSRLISILLVLALLLAGCTDLLPQMQEESNLPESVVDTSAGPVLLTGSIAYTNEFVLENYYVEHAVMLTDMTAFVERDLKWELPIPSQVLGYMDVDEENNEATYRLALPAVPEGELHDVDQDGQDDAGVQIFVVAYSPNLTGGVFSEGDDRSWGWPSYMASIRTDTENKDEVIGGKMLIWAPDDAQQFPSGFGTDGLLFTDDDPVMDVPAGYSVIDLDQQPFAILRERVIALDLLEPTDVAVKDFSEMSFVDAFQSMFDIISVEYAFNGVEGKQPNWQELYDSIMPRIENAQAERDTDAFFLALRDFSMAFRDGHVYFNYNDPYIDFIYDNVLPGYGFTAEETDAGEIVVVFVTPGGTADIIGMQPGAQIQRVNGMDVQDWVDQSVPLFPTSSDHVYRHDQITAAFRAQIGDVMTIAYTNPDGGAREVTLEAFLDSDSFFAADEAGYSIGMPVEYYLLTEDIGYFNMRSNSDDIGLIIRIFENGLKNFTENGVTNLIIDMRANGGGTNLGLAGFFYDENIPIGQLEYYSEKTGQFEPEGLFDEVYPNENQYRFDQIILLVDRYCASACELEAYGFSQVPGVVVMGVNPTAGIEAEVARGQFVLPGDIELTIPTGRFIKEDGSVLLEGQGVVPQVKIPATVESLISDEDVVLYQAIEYIYSN